MRPVSLSRFYLFTEEFKRWKTIIYADADIIVRASLGGLRDIKGFAAVRDVHTLGDQFARESASDRALYGRLGRDYCFNRIPFNAGLMAFDTGTIKKDSFSALKKLVDDFGQIFKYGDQAAFNLYFYGRWSGLPLAYNVQSTYVRYSQITDPGKVKGIILHFLGDREYRPWFPGSAFYAEWKYSLDKAEQIDLKKIPSSSQKWGAGKIFFYSFLTFSRYLANKRIGQIGLFLKKHFNPLYTALKRRETDK